MSCDKYKLDGEIKYCDVPVNGVKSMILINKADYVGVVNSTQPDEFNIVTAITLAGSKKGYKVHDGRFSTPYEGSEFGHEDSPYGSMTPKTIQFEILNNGAEGARDVMKLGSEYVAVLELTNGEFEVVGTQNMLTITDKSRILTGSEQLGWLVTMSCTELSAGVFLYDTDYDTTLSTYEALTT